MDSMHQQDTQAGWANENVHVCTSTYHIALLTPQIVCNYLYC